MNQQRLIELIHMELDGESTPEESAELSRALLDHPGGQRLQRELAEVIGVLGHSVDAEVPAELRERVLAAIPPDLYPPDREVDGRVEGRTIGLSRSIWSSSSWLRYATLFGLGVVCGLTVYWITPRPDVDHPSFDNSRLSGTMDELDSSGRRIEIGVLEVRIDSVDGSVRLFELDGAVLAQVSLRPTAEIEWILQYGGSGFTLAGIGTPPGGDLAVRNGEIRARQTGEALYLLRFEQVMPLAMLPSFRILVGDQLAFEGVVSRWAGE